MDKAKIRLSPKEAELVVNADWILTKNLILEKVKGILAEVQSRQQEFIRQHPRLLPAVVRGIPPKISKGENYKGLPYLVLDYPRFFEKEDHFAVRCMFWWGNFFSITLHLSGMYKSLLEERIKNSFEWFREQSFFIGINEDRWEHHFEASNYLPLAETDEARFREQCSNKPFLKLAKRFSLEQWDDSADLLLQSFEALVDRLKD